MKKIYIDPEILSPQRDELIKQFNISETDKQEEADVIIVHPLNADKFINNTDTRSLYNSIDEVIKDIIKLK